MPQFLYFLPRDIQAECRNLQQLIDAGATHVANYPDRAFSSVFAHTCPGEQAGALITLADPEPGSQPPAPRYDPENQVWRKGPGGKYWVGMDKRSRPTPESLIRKKTLPGDFAELGGDTKWMVPVCVPPILDGMGGSTLPMRMDLDNDGNIVGALADEFEPLARECFEYFNEYTGLGEPDPKEKVADRWNRRVKLAVRLLAINYHVSQLEVIALLGCFASNNWKNVLRAAIEADEIDRAFADVEKKASASVESATGPGTTDGASSSEGATSS